MPPVSYAYMRSCAFVLLWTGCTLTVCNWPSFCGAQPADIIIIIYTSQAHHRLLFCYALISGSWSGRLYTDFYLSTSVSRWYNECSVAVLGDRYQLLCSSRRLLHWFSTAVTACWLDYRPISFSVSSRAAWLLILSKRLSAATGWHCSSESSSKLRQRPIDDLQAAH